MSVLLSSTRGLIVPNIAGICLAFLVLYIIYRFTTSICNAFYGPLRKFPGPKLRALSILPEVLTSIRGNDNSDRIALHERYGPIVRVGPDVLSFTGGDEVWKDIYGFNAVGEGRIQKEPVFYGQAFLFSKVRSLITAQGPTHARQRKVLSHVFSDRALKDHTPMLLRCAEKLKNKLEERADGIDPVDILKYYNYTTFDIMGDLTFNEGFNMLEDSEYHPWVKTIFESVRAATFMLGLQTYSWATRQLVNSLAKCSEMILQKQHENWKYCTDRVDKRLRHIPEHPDLWSKVLEKSQGPNGLTLEEQYTNAFLFMTAGTETTATALSGTTYYLLINPEYLKRVTDEVRSTFSTLEDLDLDVLSSLTYLNAVLQEGLRMVPPVPISLPRVVSGGGAYIAGQWIPGGTVVGVHHLATYRQEGSFNRPFEFHPQRWLGSPEFKNDRLDAVKPFLTGPMNCIGKVLSSFPALKAKALMLILYDQRTLQCMRCVCFWPQCFCIST